MQKTNAPRHRDSLLLMFLADTAETLDQRSSVTASDAVNGQSQR